jgi:hypothetical protein
MMWYVCIVCCLMSVVFGAAAGAYSQEGDRKRAAVSLLVGVALMVAAVMAASRAAEPQSAVPTTEPSASRVLDQTTEP